MEADFQKGSQELKNNLLKMAGFVKGAIGDAVQSLVKRDSDLARKTIEREDLINTMEIEMNDECLKLLVPMRPESADFQFVRSVMKITANIERMGDQAVNIAGHAISLNQEPQLKPYVDIPRMAEITQSMIKDVLDAFVNSDSELALSVCEKDNLVDGLNDKVLTELLTFMESGLQTTTTRAIHLMIVCRCLERIGDYATNIAEDVLFMLRARVIKDGAEVNGEENIL